MLVRVRSVSLAVLLVGILLDLVPSAASPAQALADLWFGDVTRSAGIDFVHDRGSTGEGHLPETMGSGLAWFDLDNDGRQDLYFVQSGVLEGSPLGREQPRNELYRNLGSGTFSRVVSGAEDPGYGMGVAAADYDNDGWTDLYVSNFGPNVLYRNNGDGTFDRVANSGVEEPRWSASSSWADLDRDGFPDLFVTNYVVYDLGVDPPCERGTDDLVARCHIDLLEGLPDTLYRNRGDGTFTEVALGSAAASSLAGRGLGVVMSDLDGDELIDVYVANDKHQNWMFINQGDWLLQETGLYSGTGYSEEGKTQAGMGVEVSDLDGDGVDEIVVTNFAFEPNNLYRRAGSGMYLDETFALGLGEAGFPLLAFGIVAADADGDGDRELFVANGHILSIPEPNQVFRNRLVELRREALANGELSVSEYARGASPWRPISGLFEEMSALAGPGFEPVEVSRGMAAGDLNGDGRLDLALVNSGGPARLLRNEGGGENHWLVVRLRGRASNRDALGARVMVTALGAVDDGNSGFAQHAYVRSASSYCSQGTMDLHFGLGASNSARVEIHWPGAGTQRFDSIAADQLLLVFEGSDRVLTRPLAGRG